MKTVRIFSLIAILALVFALVPGASAGAPAGNWVSGIACQNLSTTDQATITLYFYQEGSSSTAFPPYTDPNPIPPGGSRNYYTPSSPPGVPEGFLGSVVVASDQPLACNVNTQTTGTGTSSDPYRMATSAGFADTQTAPTMYAPQVMKNLAGTWSSYIAVQNTSNADVPVTVSYKDRNGNALSANETATIKAQSNKVFYQTDNTNLVNGYVGAATIAADDGVSGLAVTVNFYNSGLSSDTAQFQSYNGFGGGANKLFVPRIVRNYYGYNGGLSIQNVGGSNATVTITFNFAGNSYTYNSPSIAPGAALALYAPNIAELNPVDGLNVTQRFGSAVIQASSGDSIVAIVNEDNRGGAGIPAERIGQGSTYNAIADGSQTSTVFFPQVTRKAGIVFSGGFQVANSTSTAGTCSIKYNADTDANESNVPLPANGSIARYAPNVANLNDGYNASVSVECNREVLGIANLAAEPGSGKLGDSATTANGLNQ
ncbi:MAG: hypothetical protein A2Z45_07005 [Chloroflexi bacterium RBG_19FT_COMBO_55_16]|nr:MAG: hypothetical protein A2Z45_07005 [Chloroflexi bacterium RBG_19FT_COMBO_55_16]